MFYFNCFILLQLTVFDSLELTVFLVVLRRREEADIQCPLDTAGYPEMKCTVCTVQCTVRANATWHPACLTKKLLSLTDIYCQSPRLPGPGTRDGHQWLGRGSQLTPSTANQIRYNTGYALWKKNGAFKEIFYHLIIILVILVDMWHFIYIFLIFEPVYSFILKLLKTSLHKY